MFQDNCWRSDELNCGENQPPTVPKDTKKPLCPLWSKFFLHFLALTRHTLPAASSATSKDPSVQIATPTGRP